MADSVYTADGRRRLSRCVCPNCKHTISRVIQTGEDEHGVIARRRQCENCQSIFFTGQEPEYLVRKENVTWSRGVMTIKEEQVLTKKGTSLKWLGLATAPYNALRRAGYETIEEVAAMPAWQIAAVPKIGESYVAAIKKALADWQSDRL